MCLALPWSSRTGLLASPVISFEEINSSMEGNQTRQIFLCVLSTIKCRRWKNRATDSMTELNLSSIYRSSHVVNGEKKRIFKQKQTWVLWSQAAKLKPQKAEKKEVDKEQSAQHLWGWSRQGPCWGVYLPEWTREPSYRQLHSGQQRRARQNQPGHRPCPLLSPPPPVHPSWATVQGHCGAQVPPEGCLASSRLR